MWIKQYKYPFTDIIQNGKIILSYQNIKFVQIGIERPHSIPIFPYEELDTKIKISDDLNHNVTQQHTYKINSSDILEFGDLDKKNLTIELENPEDPYTIITIAYEKED